MGRRGVAGGEVICSCWERGQCKSVQREMEKERERVINRTTVTITALYTCPNECSVQSTETLHTE